ncbi:VOC family protein [Myxococcus sp. K15C18031901]|uniref:VOC family protein n=1 Tax=Myxococcus dinghuensis TaxID=2906761 RepID=UPI0020A748C4|nr:VOC family protein [Myxococcus dinghuensis]MCP3103957.1 VOC family protein [Myxococcus dinghuensis]
MTTNRGFVAYDLRTTAPDEAGAFYTRLLGWRLEPGRDGGRSFFAGTREVGGLLALPERARTQGAPAHWLGHLGTEDVEGTLQRFVERGGQQLGPVRQEATGRRVAILKDAQGAVVALSDASPGAGDSPVVWHELNTTDREHAWGCYSGLFGWRATSAVELGPPFGRYQCFTWDAPRGDLGGMVDTARIPTIHTHWLFYLGVEDLAEALERLGSLGGRTVNGPVQVPSGDWVAQCEDPQGAAFALRQRSRRT